MTTITNPRIGAQIFTHKGNSGIVEQLEHEESSFVFLMAF
jgi:hypothetical protein